jgi:hypothetical protein
MRCGGAATATAEAGYSCNSIAAAAPAAVRLHYSLDSQLYRMLWLIPKHSYCWASVQWQWLRIALSAAAAGGTGATAFKRNVTIAA